MALLLRWPRLRASVEADRRDYETLDRLHSAWSLWKQTDHIHRPERLLTDLALAEGVDLISRWSDDVDVGIREFVNASRFAARARRRRQRRIVTATVCALTVLIAVSVGLGRNAMRQSRRATAEAAIADRTTQFMVTLFSLADPNENSGTATALKDILDRSVRDIQLERRLEPRVLAELLTAMGRAYLGLGRYDDSKHVLEDALSDEDRSTEPVSGEARVRTLVAYGTTLHSNSDCGRAAVKLHEAMDLAGCTLPATSALRSEALTALAETVSQQGQTETALQLCNEALAVDRKRAPSERDVLARTLDSLALIYMNAGKPEQAIDPMREALELRRAIYGTRHARTAETMDSLGALYYDLGRYEDAAKMWLDVLRIDKEIYGNEHVEVSTMLNNVGLSALMAGRLTEAEPMLREALNIDEKLRSPTHNYRVDPLLSLAIIDLYNRKVDVALAEIKRAEHIARMPDHGERLDRVLLEEADVDLTSGHVAQSEALLLEARGLTEKAHPIDKEQGSAWRYAIWDLVNAGVLAREGKALEAKQVLDKARPVIFKRFGPTGYFSLVERRRNDENDQMLRRTSSPTQKY